MKLTRRYFLQTSGALAVYCGVAPLTALAQTTQPAGAQAIANPSAIKKGKTLVAVFLRGGIDGLNLIVPYGDPAYAKLRKSIRIARPGETDGAIDLDGYFGLHPRAKALMPWADKGHFVAAQAVGYDHNTRSHFEEQDTWETGVIGNTLGSDGWLNRHLLTSEGHGPVRALSLGNSLPRILRGKATAYAVRGIDDLAMPDMRGHGAKITAALEHAYCTPVPDHRADAADATSLVHDAGADTLEGVKLIQSVRDKEYKPGAQYPKNGLGKQFAEAARLIKSRIGLEVIEISYGGWDTHNNQGYGISGQYGDKVENLTKCLAAFAEDIGDLLDDTLVLTLSDFGRTARENGTRGTDHGWANCMLALGGGVNKTGDRVTGSQTGANAAGRRKVHTDWPGLAPDQLHQKRDLKHTTDFRDVLGEVVAKHLGNKKLQDVLPGHKFKPVGLVG